MAREMIKRPTNIWLCGLLSLFIVTGFFLSWINSQRPPRSVSLLPAAGEAKLSIVISEPKDGSEVTNIYPVSGTTADEDAAIWVIVNPLTTNENWVQPATRMTGNGRWMTQAYFGRPGTIDAGKRFRIMALANPKMRLKEGDVLGCWPEAQSRSRVVEVTRK